MEFLWLPQDMVWIEYQTIALYFSLRDGSFKTSENVIK